MKILLATRTFGICIALFAAAMCGVPRQLTTAAEEKPQGKEPFGLTTLWSIHIDASAKEFDAMQPAAAGFGGPGAPPPKPKPKNDARPGETNLFGTEFPWAEGDVSIDGKSFKKAGLRYAGDITYFSSAQGLKRPLKIQLDRAGDQRFHGAGALNLHSMPLDAAKSREALAFNIFRAVGVPSPRTAFAEVTLSVPDKHDKAYLGLYTIVENIDKRFLADRFGADNGLLMKPFRVRGVDFLGEDWDRYKGQYLPQSDASKEQAHRVIGFAKLINQANDETFKKEIESYLDIDAFLRFMAANAIVSNLESFFALGHNYHLYLHPKTNKFHFLPGDLEFAFANFLLMGGPDQVMDLSLSKPYPGENKLPDRLLAIKDVNDRYQKLLKELSAPALKEQFIKDADAIDKLTKDIRDKEGKAAAARREQPGFGGAGGFGPQAPDLKTFAKKRTESIASQLSGKSKGFVPQPVNFGPPPGGGGGPLAKANNQAIDDAAFRREVTVPAEFEATLFAGPPKVNYPVAIACEPGGAIYVAVDEQGSLGRTPGGGKILRCVDKNGDGKVDDVTTFAKVDHPRGLCYRAGSLWVMHPPTLSVFHDDNGDGVSDRQEVLVTGLTSEQITLRGGDHTTNCVRMGIDGWLYIGVGDYGIKEAKGKDGRTIVQRGGGIVRVRPDGTELEVYCTGLRNPFDLAIDPFMNIFARDNTNDGAGWDTRVSLLMQSAQYGYTQLFASFTDETMPTLGTFGGGGGTGALFVQDPRWPEKFRNTLFTGDWGRSEVYRHELKDHNPTFDLKQEVFMKMPRATGMDIDTSGRLYVASWRNGSAVGFEGPNIGFVARVSPKGLKPEPFPDLKKLDNSGLGALLASPQSVTRLQVQGEILARGKDPGMTRILEYMASGAAGVSIEARVAAIFTLKQLDGKASHATLVQLAGDAAVRQFALRALTDRKKQLQGIDAKVFVSALTDDSPRVRGQALISLGRLGEASSAKQILPLTERPKGSAMPTTRPVQNQPDPDRVVPHLAVRSLAALNAHDACLESLDGPHWRGALQAMRGMHSDKAVEGLIKKLASARSPELRRGILATLIRLFHREADYTGSWWGIRPDNTGPYFDRVEWAMSKRIGAVVTAAVSDGDAESSAYLKSELARHRVSLAGVSAASAKPEKENPIVSPKADPANPNQIGNMTYEAAIRRASQAKGDAAKGKELFKSQSCLACHTIADGQSPKGPHLVDIGKRAKSDELLESILRPSAKLAQGYESYQFAMTTERVLTGFIVSEGAKSVLIRDQSGIQHELTLKEIDSRKRSEKSAMPEGLAANLTPEQLADLLAYLQSLSN